MKVVVGGVFLANPGRVLLERLANKQHDKVAIHCGILTCRGSLRVLHLAYYNTS